MPQVLGFPSLGAADGIPGALRAVPGKGVCLGLREVWTSAVPGGCSPGGDAPVPRDVPGTRALFDGRPL